jgi:ABC-type multidrug transport system fused ATPase/permease subunit
VLALLISAVIVLAFGAVGLPLWVGAHDVFAGRLSPGSLTAFIFYAVLVANAAFVLAEVYGELQRAAGASDRLLELMDTQPRIRAPGIAGRLAVAAPGQDRARGGHRSTTLAPRYRGALRLLALGGAGRARGAGGDRRARARPRSSSCCCASTIRRRERCASTAWTRAKPIPGNCAGASQS